MSRFGYEALLSLGVPYHMRCVVDNVNGSTSVANLGGEIIVRNSRGLNVTGFNGSCDILALEGLDNLEVALPSGGQLFGYCC
jgi:hypothetical protein